jgi:hypothetical protein
MVGLSGRWNGNNLKLSAGNGTDRSVKGGDTVITAGSRTNDDVGDGGNGGQLILRGGHSAGRSYGDFGGHTIIMGGSSTVGNSGRLIASSGVDDRGLADQYNYLHPLLDPTALVDLLPSQQDIPRLIHLEL